MIRETINLFFPRECEVCGEILLQNEDQMCLRCYNDLPLSYFWDWRENPAEQRFYGRVKFESVVSLFIYRAESNYDGLIRKFKYRGKRNIGVFLGRELGRKMKGNPLYDKLDYIVPIPLHPLKRFKRGYNQSLIIARAISEEIGVPVLNSALKRKRYTSAQAKKRAQERWFNVSEAFTVKNRELINNKHLLIVDDVLTTGSTIEAAASEILQSANCKLSVASLAFVE